MAKRTASFVNTGGSLGGVSATADTVAVGGVQSGAADLTLQRNTDANARLTVGSASASLGSSLTALDVNSATFALANTNATTVNFAGAATTLNIGNSSGVAAFANDITLAGDSISQAGGPPQIDLFLTTGTIFLGTTSATTVGIGSATGTVKNTGQASGELGLPATADGDVNIVGVAVASLDLNGGAVASAPATGAASSSLEFAAEATGQLKIVASTTGAMTFGGAAAAAIQIEGDLSGSLLITGATTGRLPIKVESSGSFLLTGATTGLVIKPQRRASGEDSKNTISYNIEINAAEVLAQKNKPTIITRMNFAVVLERQPNSVILPEI